MVRPAEVNFGFRGKDKTYMAKGKTHYQPDFKPPKDTTYSRGLLAIALTAGFLTLCKQQPNL